MARLAAQAGTGLTVDLTALDDQHHLTACALLTGTARMMLQHGSVLTVRNPPGGLATVLAAIPILVIYGQQAAEDTSGIQTFRVGAEACCG